MGNLHKWNARSITTLRRSGTDVIGFFLPQRRRMKGSQSSMHREANLLSFNYFASRRAARNAMNYLLSLVPHMLGLDMSWMSLCLITRSLISHQATKCPVIISLVMSSPSIYFISPRG